MSGILKGACIFGQSGGPTAVINASAYGVLKTALESDAITNVYGAAHGIRGVLDDRLYDIRQEDPDELRLLLHTPSSELGSCRYKMADPEATIRIIGAFWRFFRNTTYATSSITAAMTPWIPAIRSAAICRRTIGSAA